MAGARGEERAVPYDIGVEWSTGAPCPHLLSSGGRSFVAFYLAEPDAGWDGTYTRVVDPSSDEEESLALAEFTRVVAVRMGPPHHDSVHAHPLWERGLGAQGVYVVENSRWLAELTRLQLADEAFDEESWEGMRHFFLLFHDETVEAIAKRIVVRSERSAVRALLGRAVDELLD